MTSEHTVCCLFNQGPDPNSRKELDPDPQKTYRTVCESETLEEIFFAKQVKFVRYDANNNRHLSTTLYIKHNFIRYVFENLRQVGRHRYRTYLPVPYRYGTVLQYLLTIPIRK